MCEDAFSALVMLLCVIMEAYDCATVAVTRSRPAVLTQTLRLVHVHQHCTTKCSDFTLCTIRAVVPSRG